MPRPCPFAYPPDLKQDLAPYLTVDDDGPRLAAAFAELAPAGRPTVDFIVGLNAGIQRAVSYVVRMEPGVQSPDATLSLGSGSCRDSAWLLVQMLRRLGLAARFVSGYLIQLKHDIDPIEGALGAQTDFTDLHAWAEVYIPGAGWIGPRRDLRPAVRRGAYPARRLAPLPVRRGDHRRLEPPGRRLRIRHGGHPARRADPHNPALRGSRLGGAGRHGGAGRDRPAVAGRAPDPRRRTDLRLHRRLRGRRVEHRRLRADQAHSRRTAAAAAAGPLRPRRPAALRPGQMVSRGGPAALGAGTLLASRRPAGLARTARRAGRRTAAARGPRRRPRRHPAPRREPGPRPAAGAAGAGGPAAGDEGRERPAGRRGADRRGAGRSGRARPAAARHAGRAFQDPGLCAAAAPGGRAGRGRRMAQRGLALPARAALRDPGRLAAGPAAAARRPARAEAAGLSAHRPARPLRSAWPPPRAR